MHKIENYISVGAAFSWFGIYFWSGQNIMQSLNNVWPASGFCLLMFMYDHRYKLSQSSFGRALFKEVHYFYHIMFICQSGEWICLSHTNKIYICKCASIYFIITEFPLIVIISFIFTYKNTIFQLSKIFSPFVLAQNAIQ